MGVVADSITTAQAELGPVLPCRVAVAAQARELRVLAERALEFAGTGPTADLALALRQFERMRGVLGAGVSDTVVSGFGADAR